MPSETIITPPTNQTLSISCDQPGCAVPLIRAATTSIPLINATIKKSTPIQNIIFNGLDEKLVMPSVANFIIFLPVYFDLPALRERTSYFMEWCPKSVYDNNEDTH